MYFNAQLLFPRSKWNSHKPIYFHLICESARLFVNNVFKKINFHVNRFFKSCPICHLQLNGMHTWAAYSFYWLSTNIREYRRGIHKWSYMCCWSSCCAFVTCSLTWVCFNYYQFCSVDPVIIGLEINNSLEILPFSEQKLSQVTHTH
jgi:hypothetical protein